jgi:hypothetical protein
MMGKEFIDQEIPEEKFKQEPAPLLILYIHQERLDVFVKRDIALPGSPKFDYRSGLLEISC